jgi:hypothetical protein
MHLPWQIDSPIMGLVIIAAANTLAIVGLLATRRIMRRLDMISHHEVGGFLLTVVGTIYAVILGLIVVDSLAKFQLARQMNEREANALGNLVLLSNHLPDAQRDRVHGLAVAYADFVMNREWPLLDEGRSDPETQATALRLIEAVTEFEPKPGREQATYEAALVAVGEFWNARRYRIVTAAQSFPGAEWFLLITGGVITVTFTYFFKLDHTRVHVAMTSLVATIIALNLYMVIMFGYPYSGEVKVSSDSFGVAEAIITHHNTARPVAASP